MDNFYEHLLGCNDVLFLFWVNRCLTLQIIADLNKFENVENFNCVDGNGEHIGVHWLLNFFFLAALTAPLLELGDREVVVNEALFPFSAPQVKTLVVSDLIAFFLLDACEPTV